MSSLLTKYGTNEEVLMGHAESIVAHAGGGQTSATALVFKFNQIDTCVNPGDSVKLIASLKGMRQIVFNNSDNSSLQQVYIDMPNF